MNFKTLSVLILSDRPLFSEAILAQLQPETGFNARILPYVGTEIADLEASSGMDLVILITEQAGTIEKLLRSKFYRGPILNLVAALDPQSPLDALQLPVRYPAFVQKLRSLTSSYWFRDDLVLEIGPWTLRPVFKELIRPGEPSVALTDKEVEILIYLYRAGGKIISRDILLAEIWGYNAEVSTHTLETHIYRLRQKIETEPEISGILITETGGYRLAAFGESVRYGD